MTDEFPEFRLRLPNGKMVARGRLLSEKGAKGSRMFVVAAGSPVRANTVPSFAARNPPSYYTRQQLIDTGVIRRSDRWRGYLETVSDIECTSPSAAAEILMGCSVNGWGVWKSADGRALIDHVGQSSAVPNRPWLARGSNVSGLDLVRRQWLPEGLVTLAASRLRQDVRQGIGKDELRTLVREDYESTATYSQQQQLVEDLHAFLSRMKPGDTVCTISGGHLYVGEVTDEAEQTQSEDRRSNLRRPVEWQPTGHPYDELPEELQQKLSIQHDVVDLTSVQAHIEGLGLTDEELVEEAEAIERDPGMEIPALTVRRELELPEPTVELAAELLVHDTEWLGEVRGLRRTRRPERSPSGSSTRRRGVSSCRMPSVVPWPLPTSWTRPPTRTRPGTGR
ncbi:DUF4357 domain-containing protein [Streptomyces sp. NPDC056308]|uniref:DUF4357 domain-containing protein n=1 Tax=Streptomyces sp. NPDC056308 TaxID=3345780 RepID=UPI0035E07A65